MMKTAKPRVFPEDWRFAFSVAAAVALLAAFVLLLHRAG